MSELNQFSLFEYSDDEEWALFDDKSEDVNKINESTTHISSSIEEIQRKKGFLKRNDFYFFNISMLFFSQNQFQKHL